MDYRERLGWGAASRLVFGFSKRNNWRNLKMSESKRIGIGLNCALTALALTVALAGCGGGGDEVVVYVALDEMFSRPILEGFEKQTGIAVRPVYDTEATKTTGLITRLVRERERPRADVLWNNEIAQTIGLLGEGVVESYVSPSAEAIPAAFKSSQGDWTGFAARARVIIYNTDLVDAPPTSINDLLDPKWKGKAAIAKPLFGTTATHAAALFAVWGEERAKEFFLGLKANEVAVLAGNATVRDMVAAGEYAWGLTDTDDANGAIEDGRPVKWHFPDQEEDGLGTLVIPNTVALIKGAPQSRGGQGAHRLPAQRGSREGVVGDARHPDPLESGRGCARECAEAIGDQGHEG